MAQELQKNTEEPKLRHAHVSLQQYNSQTKLYHLAPSSFE